MKDGLKEGRTFNTEIQRSTTLMHFRDTQKTTPLTTKKSISNYPLNMNSSTKMTRSIFPSLSLTLSPSCLPS